MNPKQDIALGYLDQSENVLETEDEFPSYVNGLPTFMYDESQFDPIICLLCNQPLKFLLQIYAPINKPHCKYRTLYVFACLDSKCSHNSLSIRVFRMQSPHQPQIKQSTNQAVLLSKQPPMSIGTEIISPAESKEVLQVAKALLPTGDEDYDEEEISEILQTHINKNDPTLKEYNESIKTKTKEEINTEFSEINGYENNYKNKVDGQFLIYQHHVQEYRNHIIRYCFHKDTVPLWFSDKNQMKPNEICKHCKKRKIFEFQINNSILGFFKELFNMEWGALFIYSCPDSCNTQSKIVEESLFMQYDEHESQYSDTSVDADVILQQAQKPQQQQPKQQKQQQQFKEEDSDDCDW